MGAPPLPGGTTSRTLTVPPVASSGLLLNLQPATPDDTIPDGVQIEREGIDLMLAFHTRQSFAIQGDPDHPGGIAGITFTPAIQVVEACAVCRVPDPRPVADGVVAAPSRCRRPSPFTRSAA